MDIAILLFEGITPLDAIGPFDVLGKVPDVSIKTVAKAKGEVRTLGGSLGLVADYDFNDVDKADILLIPGGPGADATALDPVTTAWVHEVHKSTRWTASVCTGALILGGAGLLTGIKATTHWRAMDDLAKFGAVPLRERMILEDRIITTAGVSAGIDMSLHLARLIAGEQVAEAIQLAIEYDPRPPFNAGDFRTAPNERVALARTGLARP